jgi:hypothetical protein
MSAAPATKPEVRLVWLPIHKIYRSPENDLIYKPVSPNDPEIQELAESIRKHGLKEPLVVTKDGYIISGHRRYEACLLIGQSSILCRVEHISRSDPKFQLMLREFNRQRVKSFDETVREQVISMDPARAYQALIKHRQKTATVSGDFLSIEGAKIRRRISQGKQEMLRHAAAIICGKRSYWPLSDREIHYDMLNLPPLRHSGKPDSRYRNDRASYQDLCDLLTRARLTGVIPFDAIADETRTVCTWEDSIHRDVSGFVKKQLEEFLQGYWRDLQQSQPNHIEIVGEKNTVEGSIRSVAMKFCIAYTLGRGYCSLPPRRAMYERFKASGKRKLIILFLSDFDPEGDDIPNSFAKSMRDDFGVEGILVKRVCLTYEQVIERNLAQSFDMKTKGSRYKKFVAKYPDHPYGHELEAIPVADRSRLLTQAIDEVLDIEAFNHEVDAEAEDAAELEALRQAVGPTLMDQLSKPDANGKDGQPK